jgi:hypothetical protein
LSKELLIVLYFVFRFWFLSFSFLLLFVLGSFGYRHNTRSGLLAHLSLFGWLVADG